MAPVYKKCLTHEQQKEALAYLMFLKRKRCGKVKGRGCADGPKQRAYITKEESTAPTVSTEAVFLTAVIDALEGREVAVLDVPGAFMQADIDELVHIKFTGEMVNVVLQIDSEMYKDYVVVERGGRVMYMELLKALYSTLRAARLFWQKLSKQLIDVWGFTPNKYDNCVVNKTINGHQMTVVWHVDDLKVSHADVKEVDKFIQQMEETFGTDAPLSVSPYITFVVFFVKMSASFSSDLSNLIMIFPSSWYSFTNDVLMSICFVLSLVVLLLDNQIAPTLYTYTIMGNSTSMFSVCRS